LEIDFKVPRTAEEYALSQQFRVPACGAGLLKPDLWKGVAGDMSCSPDFESGAVEVLKVPADHPRIRSFAS